MMQDQLDYGIRSVRTGATSTIPATSMETGDTHLERGLVVLRNRVRYSYLDLGGILWKCGPSLGNNGKMGPQMTELSWKHI